MLSSEAEPKLLFLSFGANSFSFSWPSSPLAYSVLFADADINQWKGQPNRLTFLVYSLTTCPGKRLRLYCEAIISP